MNPPLTQERLDAIARLQAARKARGMSDPLNRLTHHLNRLIEEGGEAITERTPE